MSLRFPVTATMAVVAVLAVGAIAAFRLPLGFLPEVEFPGLEIQIPYPNALPAQVEEEITRPAEEALATMSRVRRIYSWSSANSANIFVQFDWGEDIGPLRVEAREKLDRIRDQLPSDVDQIQVNSFRSSDIPVLECRVSASRDLSRDWELLDRFVADPLRRVPGVAKVELYGVERPEVQVDLRMAALERHGVDAERLLARIDASNRSVSAGQIRREDETWPVRIVNNFANLQEVAAFPVDGRGLRLGHLADVRYREPDLDYGRHLDRSRAIGLNVIKESGANTVEVAERARAVLDAMKDDPRLTGIQVLTFTDQAADIRNSLRGLLESGLIGAALATLVLFFFLRRITATLVVALAIPVSLLAACALMYFTGRTLNILSMMGLMLAIGMLVDNAVVVLESIYRLRQLGRGPMRAALEGAREVLPAVVTATCTSVIVFLPLVVGARTEISTWIGEVGRTIIFTLGCSLLLSLTAIPLVMGRFLSVQSAPRAGAIEWLSVRHQRILEWTLRHRPATLAIAFLVVATAVLPFAKVDKSPFSGSRVERINIRYRFTDNLNYREAERYVSRVEDWIHERMDSLHVKSTYSFFSNNDAATRAYLTADWADDEGAQRVRKMMRDGLPDLPGLRLELGDDNDDGQRGSQVTVRLFGDPGPRLDQLAEDVSRRMKGIPEITDVRFGGDKQREEIQVAVSRERAAQYGLTTADVASDVALFFRGRPLSRYRGPDGEVEITARLAEADRTDLDLLRRMPLAGGDGQTVPLAALADFHTVETPASVERQERRTVVVLRGNIESRKSADVKKSVRRELDAMHFPTGYTWSFGNAFEEADETQKEMLINLLLALALVYLVMAALFESFLHPFAIMFALPFAFVGIAWISFLTHSPFNIMSQIGLLILVGIVVNNGIVLVHKVHHLRERGVERRTALLEAARDRLRPILMTTATTVLGLLPLAMGNTWVADVMYYPLARTVMGGLIASTLLTLILVPCLYTVIEDSARFVGRVWRSGPRAA